MRWLGLGLAGPIAGVAPVGLAVLAWATLMPTAFLGWRRPGGAVWWSAVALLAWMAATALWSLDPSDTLGKSAETAGLLLAAIAALRVAAPVPRWLFPAAFALGLVLAAANYLSGLALYRLLNGIVMETPVDLNKLNRNAVVLAVLAWPAALAVGRRAGLLFPAAVALLVAELRSETAIVCLAAGALAYALASLSPKLTRGALALALLIGLAGAVPLASALHEAGGDQWAWLKISGRHRVQIWAYAAGRAAERPLTGWGAHSFRHQPAESVSPGAIAIGRDEVPLHPHSLFLQSWVELGGIGAALMAAFGLALLAATAALPGAVQPAALALYAAGLAGEAFAFDMLQGWWLASLVLGAWALTAAIERGDRPPYSAPP